ncbi:hypothetical protein F4802DRAFT_610610 [Xylaria palmicola]|nr:hypothetical protein F4802DRAFT_610610 [Xylaria palmicola]
MAIERPAGRSGRGNSFLVSALRFAGYDLDWSRPSTPTSSSRTQRGAAAAKAVSSAGGRYVHALPAEVEPARALLEEYAGIPAGDVERHLYQMRDRLWDIYPYACVGRFRFASLAFAADAYYQVALFQLLQAQAEEEEAPDDDNDDGRNQTRLLDVGCCVGQVLRKLAFDGVDSARLFGTDAEPRFLELGYDLFRDRGRFKGGFVAGDILWSPQRRRRAGDSHSHEEGSEEDGEGGEGQEEEEEEEKEEDPLAVFDGTMTLVHATSFFHLFTWDDQVRAAARIVRFLRPDRPDAMVFGRQVGTLRPRADPGSDKVYLHDAASWQRLWDEVGARTGTRWRAAMEPTDKIETGAESSLRKMSFCVVRG